jgi:hypothetical protein
MIPISHRGNIDGKNTERENHPTYIDEAIEAGYDVEIDIWYMYDEIYLGHDNPQYKTDIKWLNERSEYLWIHCKNIEAIQYFCELDVNGDKYNYFWHQEDDVTLTSQNYIWAYPGKQPIKGSIAVMPEINNDDVGNCYGICSDIIKKYKDESK